jgi:3-methyladenine DNA glycosylase AlkD
MYKYLKEVYIQLEALRNPQKAAGLMKFFQAYPGGYGEGDSFYGLTVPQQRTLCKAYYKVLTLADLQTMLKHNVHEFRLTALMMLVMRMQRSKETAEQDSIANLYLKHLEYVNNWDLVDASAHYILGPWLWDKPHDILFQLAEADHLWKQRVAVITTLYFIRHSQFATTFKLAEKLLHHKHDLIHKAVGWMLREIGNRDYQTEYNWLKKHYQTMPRTMLRYAIEKFEEPVRQDFLKGRIK